MRKHILLIVAASVTAAAAGCKTVNTITNIGANAAAAAGYISSDNADSVKRTAKAGSEAFAKFTPRSIYRAHRRRAGGRKYRSCDRPAATRYVNILGQTLAAVSDRPEVYLGYRFLILDTNEVNAFAAPGGLVLVTRGLLQCCKSEDDLAAVLAHEIGHVELDHGMKSVKKGRFAKALAIIGTEAVRTYSKSRTGISGGALC